VPVVWRYLWFMRPMRLDEIWPYYSAVLKAITARALGASSSVSQHVDRALHVRCDGLVFAIRPGTDDVGMAILSVDPPRVTRFFQPKAGDTVIDVGANIGGYALRAALVAKSVIAIEPEPSNYQQLVKNIRNNHLSNVTAMQVAISDYTGETLLHLASDSGRHSLEANAWGNPTGRTLAVRLMTLDEVVASLRIERINWLKVDVERHELHVLHGAARSLSITQNLILEFELSKFPAISAILRDQRLEVLWYEPHAENSVLIARSSLSSRAASRS
jgi:FkbM family methyltransferase